VRKAHYLRANHSTETLHDLIVVDTETTPFIDRDGAERQKLWFGWACFVRRLRAGDWSRPAWCRFDRTKDFWNWCEARLHGRTRLYLIAHNWSFDALVTRMFDELPERGWKMEGACLDGPPVIIRWRRKDKTILVLDSLNWWRDSLKNLAPAAGLPKLRMPSRDASAARWDAYCRRDVRVVLRMITRWADFLIAEDLGGFAPTLASQAFRTFRHRYMIHQILIDTNDSALAMARDAYSGGRVECFRIGRTTGPIYILDVNSMYPAVMRDAEYPTKLVSVQRLCQPDELRGLMRDYCIVAECDVDLREPCLPVRHEGRLIFPIGALRGTWCTPELKLAMQHGRIVRVHRVAIYERAPIFRAFATDIWAQRQKARARKDVVRTHQWKILANSLYGKFGQRGRHWEDVKRVRDRSVRTWSELDADTGEWTHYRAIAGTLQRRVEEGESHESHPAIAAHVTAEARSLLWRMMLRAGRDSVLYVDTDSLWLTRSGYLRLRRMIDPDKLGALKLERKAASVSIYAPKDYVVDGARKIKGIRKDAISLGQGAFVQAQWRGLAGAIRDGDLLAPKITGQIKFLARNYHKGIVGKRGRVLPFRLTLWSGDVRRGRWRRCQRH